VDRYPGEPERSNRHYRDHPDLGGAEPGRPRGRGADAISPKHDRDAFKEVWLLFENGDVRFPLYPGQRTSSLTAEAGPLRTPITKYADGDRTVFEWSTEDPPLNARYRLEWRFRVESREDPHRTAVTPARPSEVMRSAGIVQRGAPVLERAARWFDLPAEAAIAAAIAERLLDALDRVATMHDFSKGLGLARRSWHRLAPLRSTTRYRAGGVPNPRVVAESVDGPAVRGCPPMAADSR
jgi:hypothetical protein